MFSDKTRSLYILIHPMIHLLDPRSHGPMVGIYGRSYVPTVYRGDLILVETVSLELGGQLFYNS